MKFGTITGAVVMLFGVLAGVSITMATNKHNWHV